jgi:MscS family membrane protein
LPVPFGLLTLLSAAFILFARRILRDPARRRNVREWYAFTRWPGILALTLVIQLSAIRFLGFPLSFRIAYAHVGLVVLVIALTWLARRVLTLGFARTRSMVWGRDSTSTQSLLLLGERLAKVLILVIAVIAILTIVGREHQNCARRPRHWRRGARARRTEDGGESARRRVSSERPGARRGRHLQHLESRRGRRRHHAAVVRLRTLEQTLLSIPAGTLSQASVENFATRAKILSQTTLRVRYGTTAEQLRSILTGIQRLIAENPKIDTGVLACPPRELRRACGRDRALRLRPHGRFPEFLVVREDLLLQAVAVVESSGSGFAQPTEFVYIDHRAAGDGQPRERVTHDDVRLAR